MSEVLAARLTRSVCGDKRPEHAAQVPKNSSAAVRVETAPRQKCALI
jgi:hypothetical protein